MKKDRPKTADPSCQQIRDKCLFEQEHFPVPDYPIGPGRNRALDQASHLLPGNIAYFDRNLCLLRYAVLSRRGRIERVGIVLARRLVPPRRFLSQKWDWFLINQLQIGLSRRITFRDIVRQSAEPVATLSP
jgi:hypothetical protein